MREEDIGERMSEILNLCETDPDEGLRLIDEMMTRHPVLKTYPFLKSYKGVSN